MKKVQWKRVDGEWIVVDNFLSNIEEHIKLFDALCGEKTVFFVRKEHLGFDELEEDEKREMAEEYYELFKAGLLHFYDINIKRSVENSVFEITRQGQSLQIEKSELLLQVKAIIMAGVLEDSAKANALCSGTFAFKTRENQSHKYYNSEGILENERQYFEWYKIDNIQELKRFIEQNQFNYNVMVTKCDSTDMQFEYYLNYYEGMEYILAVKDNKGDFCNVFAEVFRGKYLIPDFLQPTYIMLSKAFPSGICEAEYWGILHILYNDMADENLAIVMSVLADKPLGTITNDIYKVCQMDLDVKLVDEVKSKLNMCGYAEWKNEEMA